ncbi:PREDICTED: little elongation complex subunit 2 [Crocodylus porosus]|uniref:Interactor of little elongation complex ELL subunit 2 n=1 Tax=Crocodylus porosus TaxID=8502 RepID=A0A7M4EN43_CROPO|nr:PREDICTED: little elongation complex subunit 2 [Crocodylus porosus]
MAANGQLLTWDIPPKNGSEVFFSRDIYERYSLAPTLSELWMLSNRRTEKNVDLSPNHEEDKQTCNTQTEDDKEMRNTQAAVPAEVEIKPTPNDSLFPEPRIPYPYVSCLTEDEQKIYLYLLTKYARKPASYQMNAANQREYLQYLEMKELVNSEVAEFLKFAQNAAKSCAQDYDTLSEDAVLYVEQLLSACIGHVKKYPEFYILQEITSIMGGKFNTELSLKLEKCLLVLGKAQFAKVRFPVMPAQLQKDYKTVASLLTPEQRASVMHNDISSDPNAEKLALKYHPQVVLSSRSLFTLLNNHGLNYKEQWEIPVSVQMIPVEGGKPVKVVYVDSPLPKKEMTVREKNKMFHEITLDFLVSKKSYAPMSMMLLDKPVEENMFQWNMSSDTCEVRNIQTSNQIDLDFDNDFTELETFGATSKPLKTSKAENIHSKSVDPGKILSEKLKIEKQLVSKVAEVGRSKIYEQEFSESGNLQNPNEAQLLACDTTCSDSENSTLYKGLDLDKIELHNKQHGVTTEVVVDSDTKLNSLPKPDTFKRDPEPAEANETLVSCCGSDSDEERLIIDVESKNLDHCKAAVLCSNTNPVADRPKSSSPMQPPPTSTANSSESLDLGKNTPKKPSKKLSKEFDPVGQILKMQTELLKPPSPKAQEQLPVSIDKSSNPTANHIPPPLKPFVFSSMESEQSTTANAGSLPKLTWTSHFQGAWKGMLPAELKMLAEDPSEYTAPQDGNLVYKLFSLDDLLLLVRSSVQNAEIWPRSHKNQRIKKRIPVHILPKLEYQPYLGLEALTESEICRMWTENLLHSKCSFYVGHIDAFTSKLITLGEISPQHLKEKLASFKPANSLNILRNILKKVTDFQEGSYLLTHAAGDSSVAIYKSSLGKVTRASYNLHKAHNNLPSVPATLSVPWVPLDPTLPLPYHMYHGRVPCMFPPRPQETMRKQKMYGVKAHANTVNRRKSVSMETRINPMLAKPVRSEGVAAKKLRTNNCKQANTMKK